jgi:hypothetical protein
VKNRLHYHHNLFAKKFPPGGIAGSTQNALSAFAFSVRQANKPMAEISSHPLCGGYFIQGNIRWLGENIL